MARLTIKSKVSKGRRGTRGGGPGGLTAPTRPYVRKVAVVAETVGSPLGDTKALIKVWGYFPDAKLKAWLTGQVPLAWGDDVLYDSDGNAYVGTLLPAHIYKEVGGFGDIQPHVGDGSFVVLENQPMPNLVNGGMISYRTVSGAPGDVKVPALWAPAGQGKHPGGLATAKKASLGVGYKSKERRLTVKSKVTKGRRGTRGRGPGGLTAPTPTNWGNCPPTVGQVPPKSGNGVVYFPPTYLGGGQGAAMQKRAPHALGPGGAPCCKMTFSPSVARAGEWITVQTNFDVSGLRKPLVGNVGAMPLDNEWINMDMDREFVFRPVNANTFQLRWPKKGWKGTGGPGGTGYVCSVYGRELMLDFDEGTIVVSNFDADCILRVVPIPASAGKHPGGLATAKKASLGVGYKPSHRRGRSRGIGGDGSCGPGIG